MSEHVHDWVLDGDITYMCRDRRCQERAFGELCKPGELDAERAKVALLGKTNDECAVEFGRVLKELIDERDRAEAAEAKVARLREAIERAPHGALCAVAGGYSDYPCNCWKAEALKEVQRDA